MDHCAVITTTEVFSNQRKRKLRVALAEIHGYLPWNNNLTFLHFALHYFQFNFEVFSHRLLYKINAYVRLNFFNNILEHFFCEVEIDFLLQEGCMEDQ